MSILRRTAALTLVVALGAAGTAACSSAADPSGRADRSLRAGEGELGASVVNGALELRNNSQRRLYYHVADPHFLGLWAACTDGTQETCRSIAPGGTVRVPRASIFGVSDRTAAVTVYWWDDNFDPSGSDPSRTIKELQVEL